MLVKTPLAGLITLIFTVGGATGQTVDQSRGVDPTVDYGSLVRFGPWDDRNYGLTAEDLALLAPNEEELPAAIPAFYRAELRRKNPGMSRAGRVQYPRSALPSFFIRYGGYRVDGTFYLGAARQGSGYTVDLARPRPWPLIEPSPSASMGLSTDVRMTTPEGAETSAIAIHPTNRNLVVAGSNGPASGQKMHHSSDGGSTWNESTALPLGSTCCNPSVAWSADGSKAYAATLSSAFGTGGVWFYRSGDSGQTWSDLGVDPRRELGGSGYDKEYLHVDTHTGSPHVDNIYLTWNENNTMRFARSVNFGSSWSTPISVSSGSDQLGSGSDITSDRNGDVYYFWAAFNGKKVWVARSIDGGVSFLAPVEVAATQASFSFPIPSMETREALIYISAAADLSSGPFSGSLYAVWTDSTAATTVNPADNHGRVLLAYSRDGGGSWTTVTPHETADADSVDRWHPWLAVGTDGAVHVVFYDTRRDATRASVDLFYTRSTDGGQTFISPRRLTAEQSPNISNALEFGDYNGLDVFLNDAIGSFTDNRDEDMSGGDSRDIYASGVVACTASATVVLMNQTLGDTQAEDRRACDTLTADPDVLIAADFPVSLRAVNRVILGDGFVVANGAEFVVEVNPALIAE